MLKNNKITLIITSVLILLPMLFGLAVWEILPEEIAVHWGINGNANGFAGKSFAIFVLPLILLAAQWLCVLITAWDNRRKNQNPKVIRMLLWIFPIISIFTSAFTYLAALGITNGITAITFILLAIIFIVIGNYLPKTRQNHTIGIKISWTLESEENWNATHRMAGKLWVICGVLMLFTSLLPVKLLIFFFFAELLIAIIVPMVYSYRFHRKELKEGKEIKPSKATKGLIIVSVIMLVAIIILAAMILFTGDIRYVQGENELMMTSFGNKTYIEYSEIDDITLIENADYGIREYGFGTPRLLMGRFRNDEYGSYSLYAYAKNHTAIELKLGDWILVINHETRDNTLELYEGLKDKID